MCVKHVTYGKGLCSRPCWSDVTEGEGSASCLQERTAHSRTANSPLSCFLGCLCNSAILQKATPIFLFGTRWGPPSSLAIHSGGWVASGGDCPKLISERASRKLSDQVTRHGGKAYTCLDVKSPRDKYI